MEASGTKDFMQENAKLCHPTWLLLPKIVFYCGKVEVRKGGNSQACLESKQGQKGLGGVVGGEGDGAPWQHTGMGCWAEGKSRAVGWWKEGGLLCLHPELLPDFGEEALDNPPPIR